MTPKGHFEINWPLKDPKTICGPKYSGVSNKCAFILFQEKSCPVPLSPRPHKKGQWALQVYRIANFVALWLLDDSKRSEMTPNDSLCFW
jgi:hypothetical protein